MSFMSGRWDGCMVRTNKPRAVQDNRTAAKKAGIAWLFVNDKTGISLISR